MLVRKTLFHPRKPHVAEGHGQQRDRQANAEVFAKADISLLASTLDHDDVGNGPGDGEVAISPASMPSRQLDATLLEILGGCEGSASSRTARLFNEMVVKEHPEVYREGVLDVGRNAPDLNAQKCPNRRIPPRRDCDAGNERYS
jgi:hypothetical protein